MKKTSFLKRILKGFLALLILDVGCLIFGASFISFFNNFFVGILGGIIFSAFLAISMIGYAYDFGQEDRKLEKRGIPRDTKMSFKLAGTMMVFPLLPWIVLIANKAGIFSWNFLPIYKLLNSFYIPFMQIFSEDGKIANFPLYGFAILFLLILIIPVSIYFGYDFGYRDIDLTMKIFYEKNHKQ